MSHRTDEYGPLLRRKTDKDPSEGLPYRVETWLDVKPSDRIARPTDTGESAAMFEHRSFGLPPVGRLTSAEAAILGGFRDRTTSEVVGDPARFRHFDLYWEAGTAPRLVSVRAHGTNTASVPGSDNAGTVQSGHNGAAALTGQLSDFETAFGAAGSDSTEIWNIEAVLADVAGSRGYERVVWHLV